MDAVETLQRVCFLVLELSEQVSAAYAASPASIHLLQHGIVSKAWFSNMRSSSSCRQFPQCPAPTVWAAPPQPGSSLHSNQYHPEPAPSSVPTLGDFILQWLPSWTPPSKEISPATWRGFLTISTGAGPHGLLCHPRIHSHSPFNNYASYPWDHFLGYLSFIYYSCIFQCSLLITSQSLFTPILLELVILYIKLSLFKVLYSLCVFTWPW